MNEIPRDGIALEINLEGIEYKGMVKIGKEMIIKLSNER